MSPPKPEHHLVGLFVQKTVLESPLCAAVREEDRVPLVASPLAEELSRRARLEVRRSRDDAARSDQVLELAYFGDGSCVHICPHMVIITSLRRAFTIRSPLRGDLIIAHMSTYGNNH